MVLKGGVIAWAQMGDPNASIPTPQVPDSLTDATLRVRTAVRSLALTVASAVSIAAGSACLHTLGVPCCNWFAARWMLLRLVHVLKHLVLSPLYSPPVQVQPSRSHFH